MNRLIALSVAVAGVGILSATSAPVPPETRRFLYVNNNDTGSETFTRSADSLRGDMAVGRTRVHYDARLSADGTIPRLDIRTSVLGNDSKVPTLITVIVGRDSTQLIEHRGREVDTLRLASAPGSIPVINPSMGLIEVVVARARSQHARTTTVPILFIDALNLDVGPTAPLRSRAGAGTVDVTFLRADTVRFSSFLASGAPRANARADQLRVVVGSDGRVRGAVSGADAKDHFSAISRK
jgi:hypothetical protein